MRTNTHSQVDEPIEQGYGYTSEQIKRELAEASVSDEAEHPHYIADYGVEDL